MRINAVLLLLFFPLACFAQEFFKNDQEGYSLTLPPQLKVAFKRAREKNAAAASRLPFDYVNFRPTEATGDFGVFELGLGVHWNRDNLGTREFADKKDEGLKMKGARIVTIGQSEVTVANTKGVRDDFRMQQPEGWLSYSRVIIPVKDKFIVFLCTLGQDAPIAENEQVFQKILDSFTLN
jgi:hypothetical protein